MAHPFYIKAGLVAIYSTAMLVPFTSQFFLPATPIFSWLLFFYSSQFIPKDYRPHIWVSVLPTLESILYGANISDLLTRKTNWILDLVAWFPYGLAHFVLPFVVAALLFIFSPPGAVKFWGAAFGYMNLAGVLIQVAFPCAPPCTPILRPSSLPILILSSTQGTSYEKVWYQPITACEVPPEDSLASTPSSADTDTRRPSRAHPSPSAPSRVFMLDARRWRRSSCRTSSPRVVRFTGHMSSGSTGVPWCVPLSSLLRFGFAY